MKSKTHTIIEHSVNLKSKKSTKKYLKGVMKQLNKQKPPQIIIEVSGGIIQDIYSHKDIDIVIVDHDRRDVGENPVYQYAPNIISSKNPLHVIFSDNNNVDNEIREELKSIKF